MNSKEEAKQKLAQLISTFEANPRKDSLTEQETREFVRSFFEILNWNFLSGEEVSQEEHISKGFVDYGFRLNGVPKMFVEAKKTANPLSEDKDINQAISYSWSKATTWAILTNFKRIRIFNAYVKGQLMAAQLNDLELKNYLEQFDTLWLLSKQSFEIGLIDKEAEKLGKIAKRMPVEKQLFQDLNKWRELIAKDLKKNYISKYDEEVLDEIIQTLLDRLILIRKIEDTGLEGKKLEETYHNWNPGKGKKLSELLDEVFHYFDSEYDSQIFDQTKNELDKVIVSDSVLKEIMPELYRSSDGTVQYDFSYIPADILGNIYEQYLGYLLKTSEKRATVTEKKSKRKEQGIYYTPTYIVDYIVKNTLGEKLKECKNLQDVEKLKVLDPACGSGSFLIRAFDEIYNWYKEKGYDKTTFLADNKNSHKDFETVKDRIIKNNLFGVDLDQKAVEIARLNLLLKTADKKHKLPQLQENIKVGNSLIDDPTITKHPFSWNIEFEKIMENGGFDVGIGNPPYINIYLLSKNEKEVKYYQKNYFTAYKKFDLYVLFIERAIKLLKDGGRFSFIIPDKFLSQPYGLNLRKFILDSCCIEKIVNLAGFKIFESATVENVILILKKETSETIRNKNKIKIITPASDPTAIKNISELAKTISQQLYRSTPDYLFRLNISPDIVNLKRKMEESSKRISDFCYVNWGARSGDIKTFVVKEKKNQLCKPMLDGRDINRYSLNWDNKYLVYDKEKLYNPMFEELFENEKLIIRDVNANDGIKATFDNEKYYTEHTVSLCMLYYRLYGVNRRGLALEKDKIILSKEFDLKYVLGILNSRLMTFYFKTFIGCGLHVYPDNIKSLPIKQVGKKEQTPVIELVDEMLSLNKRLVELDGKQTEEARRVQEEIKRTDSQIDALVYGLYGITEDEKKLIENSFGGIGKSNDKR